MDLQEVLNNAADAMRAKRMKTSPQLTVGELILKLEFVKNKHLPVVFDSDFGHPTNLDSWRGSYNELAFDYQEDGKPLTVQKILQELRSAIGKTYTGYKGGEYIMGKTTPLWISHYGDSDSIGVIDVSEGKKEVTIRTAECEF